MTRLHDNPQAEQYSDEPIMRPLQKRWSQSWTEIYVFRLTIGANFSGMTEKLRQRFTCMTSISARGRRVPVYQPQSLNVSTESVYLR